jgi:predicted ATPase
MITTIRLQNFKGHRDTTVPLGRLTLFVGGNGSGKSSALEALSLLAQLGAGGGVQHGAWGADRLRCGAPWPIVLEATGNGEGAWTSRVSIMAASVESSGKGSIGLTRLFKLNAAKIGAAAYSDEPAAEVEVDGTNTAVALTSIKLGNDEAFDRIERDLRKLVPSVERVRIQRAVVSRGVFSGVTQNLVGSKIYLDFRGAPDIPAHAASEGTLILLGLLTILHGSKRPKLLLLDDFDQSLHPEAQLELVRLIKGLFAEFPDLQIVATTHSPYILDELDPADVHAFALRDDGSVAVKRLSEHPEAEKLKGKLSAGQLWSLDPERKWVLAEKAA